MTDQGQSHRGGVWLSRLAVTLAVTTFALVVLGGTVTSKGVGLAVPDWPTTFEQNMFLFPPSMWKGGVFWEHTHRLLGSVVGMLAIGVLVGLCAKRGWPAWLRWFGGAVLVVVIVQGVMGGLRVTELSTGFAVAHGVLAQLFFCMTVLMALAVRRYAAVRSNSARAVAPAGRPVRVLSVVVIAVLVVQLVLGAAMRHTGARLAIPDFPTSYGRWLPPVSQAVLDGWVEARPYEEEVGYYSVGQVWSHFAHRAWAAVVVGAVVWLLAVVGRDRRRTVGLSRAAAMMAALLLVQPVLGVLVVWTGPSRFNAEVATAHQATGALLLAVAAALAVCARWPGGRVGAGASHRAAVDDSMGAIGGAVA